MKKLLLTITICLVAVAAVVFTVKYIVGGSGKDSDIELNEAGTESGPTRPYYGTAGYVPANFPSSSAEEIHQFFDDVEAMGEIHGVHTDWQDTTIVDVTIENTDMDLVVVLGFQDPARWKEDKYEFVQKVMELFDTYPEIKYLGIGNEVNLFKYGHAGVDDSFLDVYKEIYTELKLKYPDRIIFTTFQYEALLGNNYLSGKSGEYAEDWYILAELDGYNDIVALTSYPFLDYLTPDQIPDDYYSQIMDHSDLPIAFTEIGWLSQESFNGAFATLNGTGYEGSEDEQMQFLQRFNYLTTGKNMHFANWSFLNDPYDWSTGGNSENPIFDSVGLRNSDGTPKKVTTEWESSLN